MSEIPIHPRGGILNPSSTEPTPPLGNADGSEMPIRQSPLLSRVAKQQPVSTHELTRQTDKNKEKEIEIMDEISHINDADGAPRDGLAVLQKVNKTIEDYTRKIEIQKRTKNQLDDRMAMLKREIENKRKKVCKLAMGTKGLHQTPMDDMSRRDQYVHRKLNHALEELNNAFSNNMRSHNAINNLRSERVLHLSNQLSFMEDIKNKKEKIRKIENKIDDEAGLIARAEGEMEHTRPFFKNKINELNREWNEMSQLLEVTNDNELSRLRAIKAGKEMVQRPFKVKRGGVTRGSGFDIVQKPNVMALYSKNQKSNVAGNRRSNLGKNIYERGRGTATVDDQKLKWQRDLKQMMILNQVGAGELSMEEESGMRKTIQQGKWTMARDKMALSELDNRVQDYEMGFKMIQEQTGVSDVDELVDQFVKREETNFNLFNTINELSATIEDLEEGVSTEKYELEKFKTKEDVGLDGRSVLASLERKLQRVNQFMTRDVQASEHATVMLNELRGDVGSLFVTIGCESSLVERLLGVASVVQEKVPSGGTIVENKSDERGMKKEQPATSKTEAPVGATPKPSSIAEAIAKLDAENSGKFESSSSGIQTQTPVPQTVVAKPVSTADNAEAASTDTPMNSSSDVTSRKNSVVVPHGSKGNAMLRGGRKARSNTIRRNSNYSGEPMLEITENNILQFMGVVEERVTALVMEYQAINRSKGNDSKKQKKAVAIAKGPANRRVDIDGSSVVPPTDQLTSAEYMDDWSDEDETTHLKPMTHEELLRRISESSRYNVKKKEAPHKPTTTFRRRSTSSSVGGGDRARRRSSSSVGLS